MAAMMLLEIPASEVRKGDLVTLAAGCELRRVERVEPSTWPGSKDRSVLAWFADDTGQHFSLDVPVFVVRRG